MTILIVILIAIIASIIGAVPLGLVNLSVLDTSYRNGTHAAMKISHGASWIEVLYSLIAIFTGTLISKVVEDNVWVQSVFILIPIFIGLVFLFKRANHISDTGNYFNSFLKGVLLNLLSVQVLFYWILVLTFINSYWLPDFDLASLLVFSICVWAGKMFVLWIYAKLSKIILSRVEHLSDKIDKVIGVVLILSGVFLYLKENIY